MSKELLGEKPRMHVEIEAPYNYVAGSLALDLAGMDVDLPFRPSTIDTIQRIQLDCPEIEARVEQLECLDALEEARESGDNKALTVMATGLGKTTGAAADARRFLEQNPGSRVLFLCHKNRILDQARERFERVLGGERTYATLTGEDKDYHETTCLFASFKMMSSWHQAFFPDEFDYIAVDESHHAKAPTYEPVLRYFSPKFLHGMTGTPDRRDLKDIRDIFGPEKYRKPLDEAIAEGLLSPVDYKILTDKIAAENVLRDIRDRKYNINQLNRTIFAPVRDEVAARICIEDAKKLNGPVRRLVFCESIEHTEEFAQYFPNAAPMHSKLPRWENKKYLDQFRNGEIETLLTIDMFNEGIDVPEVNQVVFMRQTESKTIFLQQLGRGLRKMPGKELVQVRDFVANCERLALLDEFWKDVASYPMGDPEYEDVARIDVGNVNFTDIQREILDILAEIETNNSEKVQWTAEDSMSYYTGLSAKLGRYARTTDIDEAFIDKEGPSRMVLLKHFNGRISDLRVACGVEVFDPNSLSDEDVVALALKLKPDSPMVAGEITDMSKREIFVSVTQIARRFGSIRGFQRACGFEVVDYSTLTNDKIIEMALTHSPDRPLYTSDLAQLSKERAFINHPAVMSRFGSLLEFHKACGFDVVDARKLSTGDAISLALELKPEGLLTGREIDALAKDKKFVSTKWIRDHFGTVQDFQRACGFEVRTNGRRLLTRDMSDEEIISLALSISPDAPLGEKEVVQLSLKGLFASAPTLVSRFGSIPEFQAACGFEVELRKFRTGKFTKEELIEEALSLKPEGPLTTTEIRMLCENNLFVGASTIAKHFGSIPEFQAACGFEVSDKRVKSKKSSSE